MRIVFMGSAEIACHSLDALLKADGVEVVAVVTQPDRCRGRNLRMCACPAKEHVAGIDIDVFSPRSINTPESLERLRGWKPDLIVVMAYGQILKPQVLNAAPLGCINVHTSLLPAYRGAAPIQWAIAGGESRTGVTIMQMDEGMDSGAIILQRSIDIGADETAGELHDRLGPLGAELLVQAVREIRCGCAERTPQDDALVTYAPKLSKRDGEIDWHMAVRDIHNRVRGFNPWPCCYCHVPDRKHSTLRVLRAAEESGDGIPGEVLDVKGAGPLVACGGGALRLLNVQPEGKRVMTGREYICGHALQVGEILKDK